MSKSFLQCYAECFARIPGWFSMDAAVLMMLFHQLAMPPGDVLEIGVYQGLSAIGVAAMRGSNRRFYAIDPFREQIDSIPPAEIRAAFLEHMSGFHAPLDFMTLLETSSAEISCGDLHGDFSLAHVDGDHSVQGALHDIELAEDVLAPGGILVLDDYYNPAFPGVTEAIHHFWQTRAHSLKVVAYGFGKLILQKEPAGQDLRPHIGEIFPKLRMMSVTMWGQPALVFSPGLHFLFNLARSTPHRLVMVEHPAVRALLAPQIGRVRAARGTIVSVPVRITNQSPFTFQAGNYAPIQLGYHVLDGRGKMLVYDNPRTALTQFLGQGQSAVTWLRVQTPTDAGSYRLQVDLVWEGIAWFRDCGNRAPSVCLDVF